MCFDFRIPREPFALIPRVHMRKLWQSAPVEAAAVLPVFSSPGFTKDGESSVLGFANVRPFALPLSFSLAPYIRLDLSVCGPRNVVGVPSPPCLSRASFFVSLSLFDKHRVPPFLSPSPASLLSLSVCLCLCLFLSLFLPSSLSLLSSLFLPRQQREAKRRLFRRECFHRNAETVLIADCLA